MTEISNPLDLAKQVAEAMGPEWTAESREYRQNDSADIVNEQGDTIFLVAMGRSGYRRANEEGKVKLRASSSDDLRAHYAYGAEWPETMVSEERGPQIMAKAALRKLVPTLVENNRVARERAAQYAEDVKAAQALSQRLAAALMDFHIRDLGQGGQRGDETDHLRVGSHMAGAMITGGRVTELTVRDIPADMAERFLREVKAHRDTQTTD